MVPTHRNEEEGRPYKDYAYSPVPVSSYSALNESTSNPSNKDTTVTNIGLNECCHPSENQIANSQGQRNNINQLRPRGNTDMSEKGSQFLQYLAAAAGNICVFATGAMLGWTSPILPKLTQHDPISSDNPLGEAITSDESSWIGSLVAMGAIYGSFAAGYMAERIGRKNSLLLCILPFTIGWILVATAHHVVQLYIARLVFGFSLAFPFTVIPMYVGEIADTSIRGVLGSFLQLFITAGLLYSYAIGPFVSYTVFWILCAALFLVFFLCFITMPESPYYLLSKGRKDEAISSLVRLRGKTVASVQKEADEMQAAVEESFRQEASISDLFKVKANFKALVFTCALASFQQFTGINVVLFYMENIFKEAGTSMDSSISTIIVGIVQVLASAVTPLIVDKLGRRMLLVLSGIGETLTLSALGLFFYLKDSRGEDTSSIGWLPVVALMIYISSYSVGWGPLPWTVMGEMFASNVKSKASGITVSICWLLAFFITKYSSNIEVKFGMHTTFWAFAICCGLSLCFTLFLLPETKGKSLQQIQDELNGVKTSPPINYGSSGSAVKT